MIPNCLSPAVSLAAAMSAKKSFSGTPYSRPPSTPRQQLVRQESTPGSILKTFFSPSKWFSKRSTPKPETEDADEDEGSSDSGSSGEDEEAHVGLDNGVPTDQVQKPNTERTVQGLHSQVQTPVPAGRGGHRSNPNSPNAVLATFFESKGDAPLTSVELEGVKALLARQSTQALTEENQIPSYATPTRRPYQPIFTPANMVPATRAVTEVRKVRRGYTPSTTASSPFEKRHPSRTGFSQGRLPHPAQFTTPAKYALQSIIPAGESETDNGKRTLDKVTAPAAKRARQDEVMPDKETSDMKKTTPTGSKTAASMLEILDDDSGSAKETQQKSPDQIKAMLNPYATASSGRKPLRSPRRTPARKESRSAIEEIARNDAIEKRIPYQPKKSSGLVNSFSAEDDTSLFSPKRRMNASGLGNGSLAGSSKKNDGSGLAQSSTPTKTTGSLTSAFGATSEKQDMFVSAASSTPHSTTPKFSFGASQMSSKSSMTTTVDDSKPIAAATLDTQVTPKFDSEKDTVTEHQLHGGFTFGQTSSQIKPTTEEVASNAAKEGAKDHSAFGGFPASTEKAVAPSFGLGSSASTTDEEHKGHGGFTFSKPSEVTQSDLSGGEKVTRDDSEQEDDVVVHQLRDGTEYVSPSKSRGKAEDPAEKEGKPAPGGFVFAPTHTKSSSSFSFSNYKEPQTGTTTSGGFSFDANKKVDIIGKTIGDLPRASGLLSTTTNPPAVAKEMKRDARMRALAVPEADLYQFGFTNSAKQTMNEKKQQVLVADLVTYNFTIPASVSGKTDTTSGFDWTAAGMKRPDVGWTCDVCMVNNKTEARQCVSCESESPSLASAPAPVANSAGAGSSGQSAPASSSAPTGGFNWAAAGMKVPDQQWSCSLCMTSNPTSANACLSCETER